MGHEGDGKRYDVVIVGAGFAGMYMLHRVRSQGLSVRVFERGSGVGGTWFWNRYPGARCDVESLEYQYGFSDDIQRRWTWSERFAGQPEILRYQNYVADKLDLRRDIQFETRVKSTVFRESEPLWEIKTDKEENVLAQFVVLAVGCLSKAKVPKYPGIGEFKGQVYHTGKWPEEGVDFTGKRVAVIGTGSSGTQCIPLIAEQAEHLTVFQRTPNFSIPRNNRPLSDEEVQRCKDSMLDDRKEAKKTTAGLVRQPFSKVLANEMAPEERLTELEWRWHYGGFAFLGTFADQIISPDANEIAADFARSKMRAVIKDPELAEKLMPRDHPIGTKRPCLEYGYLETFNRPNVEMVNARKSPIESFTANGLVCDHKEYSVDSVVFATGYNAMIGAILGIDIIGRNGEALRDKWADGPRTYLGLTTANFPNLFFITGPGSPSVLGNVITSIEQHVEWIGDCIEWLRKGNVRFIEAQKEAEDTWMDQLNAIADMTLFARAPNTWYWFNEPEKSPRFMPYLGGIDKYEEKLVEVVGKGYEGFVLGDGRL
eukprot:TRINITY_DN5216_c0_g1_i1.p1 TRINITY_DN5216_c0_g1~~TRINITY_DN5216_c0_g1_i1.p1  ORF type:complete len:541 (-),score=54.88 TRINITY_DN5216_c0_g1_i1:190-1812(-)